MPAYSFKERFIPMVKDRTKRQTIRNRRAKGYAKPGDPIYLYYGMRTRHCQKIGESTCTSATSIAITADGKVFLFSQRLTDQDAAIILDKLKAGKLPFPTDPSTRFITLTTEQKNKLAWNDGFRPEGSTAEKPVSANYTGWPPSKITSFELMLHWWQQTHELPFLGDIIYW